ncbi:MAG: hypothetical protein RLN70_08090, partial [Rhodospirillaceae bacterium]
LPPALHLAQHTHDPGFGKTSLLNRSLLVHSAEKNLFSHPFKIRGITRAASRAALKTARDALQSASCKQI